MREATFQQLSPPVSGGAAGDSRTILETLPPGLHIHRKLRVHHQPPGGGERVKADTRRIPPVSYMLRLVLQVGPSSSFSLVISASGWSPEADVQIG